MLGFEVVLLKKFNSSWLKDVSVVALERYFRETNFNYEDELYLVHAEIIDNGEITDNILDISENRVLSSPVWSYMLAYKESLPPVEMKDGIVHISHLYRSFLLDSLLVLFKIRQARSISSQEILQKELRSISIPAFIFYTAPVVLLHLACLLILSKNWGGFVAYLSPIKRVSVNSSLIEFMISFIVEIYLVLLTPPLLTHLWKKFVNSPKTGNQQLFAEIKALLKQALRKWINVVFVLIGVSIVAGLFAIVAQNLLTK